MKVQMRILFVLGVALTLGGCSATKSSSPAPQETLKSYLLALKQKQYDRAYAMTSRQFQKQMNKNAFIRYLGENPNEVRQTIERLEGKEAQVTIEAAIPYGPGDRLILVLENGAWRIATDPTDFYAQDTPAKALRSFVRAIERRRYDLVLRRFIPAERATTLSSQLLQGYFEGAEKDEAQELINMLKANLSQPIHIEGDKATMPYGEHHAVRFVREEGLWKILDPQ